MPDGNQAEAELLSFLIPQKKTRRATRVVYPGIRLFQTVFTC